MILKLLPFVRIELSFQRKNCAMCILFSTGEVMPIRIHFIGCLQCIIQSAKPGAKIKYKEI